MKNRPKSINLLGKPLSGSSPIHFFPLQFSVLFSFMLCSSLLLPSTVFDSFNCDSYIFLISSSTSSFVRFHCAASTDFFILLAPLCACFRFLFFPCFGSLQRPKWPERRSFIARSVLSSALHSPGWCGVTVEGWMAMEPKCFSSSLFPHCWLSRYTWQTATTINYYSCVW